MNVDQPTATKASPKISILLMDANSERRALRKKILALHGIEVVGASDLSEASAIWHRDRYHVVLLDIRMDHQGCLAWRDEIKKEKPQQIVAFLVGKPNYIELDPSAGSYLAEEQGAQWGDKLRKAIRESCGSLPQRYGFVEAGWRIATARKLNGISSHTSQPAETATSSSDSGADTGEQAPATADIQQVLQVGFRDNLTGE